MPPVRQPRRFFYGWWLAIALATMSAWVGGALYYGFTAFFLPMLDEFGWSRAEFSVAFAASGLEGAAIAPLVGWIVDRFGARRPMVIGVIIGGLGFIGLANINSLATFYAAFVATGIGFAIAFSAAPPAVLANWFIRRRSLAMGMMLTGYAVSGTLVPALVWLIGLFGWRTSLLLLGLLTWLLCIPLSLTIRHRPEPYGYLPDGDPPAPATTTVAMPLAVTTGADDGFRVGEALRTRAFWLLTLGIGVSWAALNAIIVHFIPYLVSVGIDTEVAALGVTILTLLSAVGRLGFGWLGDYYSKRHLMALCFALQFVGTMVFALTSEVWHLLLALFVLGPSYGGAIPLRLALQGDYFGRHAFATLAGLMMAATTLGSILTPVFAGWFYDVTGGYRLAFLSLGVVAAVGIPLVLAATPPRRPTPQTTADAIA